MSAIVQLILTTFFLIQVVRVLPPFKSWTDAGIKPWACDICLSCWAGLLVTMYSEKWDSFGTETAIRWFATSGGSLLLLLICGILAPPMAFPPEDK